MDDDQSSEQDIIYNRNDDPDIFKGVSEQIKEMDAFSLKLDFLTERWGKREDSQINVVGKSMLTGRSLKTIRSEYMNRRSENQEIRKDLDLKPQNTQQIQTPRMETISQTSPEEFGAYQSFNSNQIEEVIQEATNRTETQNNPTEAALTVMETQ